MKLEIDSFQFRQIYVNLLSELLHRLGNNWSPKFINFVNIYSDRIHKYDCAININMNKARSSTTTKKNNAKKTIQHFKQLASKYLSIVFNLSI